MPDSRYDERFLRSSVLIVVEEPGRELLLASAQVERFAGRLTILARTRPPWWDTWVGLLGASAEVREQESPLLDVIAELQPKFVLIEPSLLAEAQEAIRQRAGEGAMPPFLLTFGSGGRRVPLTEPQRERKRRFAEALPELAARLPHSLDEEFLRAEE
jgi:hypothetical protein